MSEKFYLTTPIYYVNDVAHIGHAYTTIVADIVARYQRQRGAEVRFLTGTDENSQKNLEAAAKNGFTDIQSYLDQMAGKWAAAWEALQLTNDDFIRTTEPRHKAAVEKFWRAVQQNSPDDIYRGEYVGLYCVGCEKFMTKAEVNDDNRCPLHPNQELKEIREENWFFRLSSYRERLLQYIDDHPEFIQPVSRRNEVRSYVDKFMEDISISRQTQEWGIPVPDDPDSVIYVWFDALINYLSGCGYGTDDEQFARWWPANLHLVGKDIIKFHCALWPAMLMAAGLEPPRQVFAHGFFTVDGQKMSKSLGNVVPPQQITDRFGRDTLRFFLVREMTFGDDGDFSFARLEQRYANDLANELGNLLHRSLSMTDKYFDGAVPPIVPDTLDWPAAWTAYDAAMERLDFATALDVLWGGSAWDGANTIRALNRYIDERKPWLQAKEADRQPLQETIYTLLEGLRQLAIGLEPIMPEIAAQMLDQLGVSAERRQQPRNDRRQWSGLKENDKIAKGEPLFPRIESLDDVGA
jgi:methionyl-tRNA synthetase